jgi:hypothetical protein
MESRSSNIFQGEVMRKSAKIALLSLAGMIVVAGSAIAGFYKGIGVGAGVMGDMAANNRIYDDLSQVRSSMVALENSDLSLSQRQLTIHLREALFDLAALSKAKTYVKCTDDDKHALAQAAGYVASHPDPQLPGFDHFLASGTKFCESKQSGPEVAKADKS